MVGGCPKALRTRAAAVPGHGQNITHVGGSGDGQTAKVANQIIVALNIQAVAEALLFAAKNGADPAKVREALMGSFAGSKILEVHGERMIKGTFDPGFRISLHQKDLNLALAGARELGLNLPNTANAQQVFSTCSAIGGSNWDHSALIKGLEHGQFQHPRRVSPSSVDHCISRLNQGGTLNLSRTHATRVRRLGRSASNVMMQYIETLPHAGAWGRLPF